MKRYILTGAPGSGKTSVGLMLEQEGFCVLPEAATSICTLEQALGISEPWKSENFIEKISNLQNKREICFNKIECDIQFLDRSFVCIYALAKYMQSFTQFEIPASVKEEIELRVRNQYYQNDVFFFENLGYVQHTDVRKITLEEARVFEEIHKASYLEFGFNIISIKNKPIPQRTQDVLNFVQSQFGQL